MQSRDDALLIAERLAALPLETPPAAAWAAIRQQLVARTTTPTAMRTPAPWWLALAAGVAAVVIAPSLRLPVEPPAPSMTPDTAIAALKQRSQSLENEIRNVRAGHSEIADVQFQWEQAVEDDLALVDVGLAARSEQPEQLWRERVRLLEELKTAAQTDSAPLLLQARLD